MINSLFGFVIIPKYISWRTSCYWLIFLMRCNMFSFDYARMFRHYSSFFFCKNTVRWLNVLWYNMVLGSSTYSSNSIWWVIIHWLDMTRNKRFIVKWSIIQLATLRIFDYFLSILRFSIILTTSIYSIKLLISMVSY